MKTTSIMEARTNWIIDRIQPHIYGSKILDLGSGGGHISNALINNPNGYEVTPTDTKRYSTPKDVEPIIYDGKKLPFEDKAFDTTLIIYVLHHTTHPEDVLVETIKKTKKRIIILEDVYRNKRQAQVFKFIDSALNRDFFNHPHSNKSHEDWLELFEKLELQVTKAELLVQPWLGLKFPVALYVLDI